MLSKSKLTGFVFFVLSFAGIMALLIQGSLTLYGESLKNGAGGLIGVVIVKMLRAYFNLAGTYIILFLIFIIALTFIFEFSMVSVTERISLFLLPFSIFLKTEFLLLSVTSRAVKKRVPVRRYHHCRIPRSAAGSQKGPAEKDRTNSF